MVAAIINHLQLQGYIQLVKIFLFFIPKESKNILSWKGPKRITESNSCVHIGPPHQKEKKCLRALSKLFLDSRSRLSAMTAALGSLIQCPIILSVGNFFLISSLNPIGFTTQKSNRKKKSTIHNICLHSCHTYPQYPQHAQSSIFIFGIAAEIPVHTVPHENHPCPGFGKASSCHGRAAWWDLDPL